MKRELIVIRRMRVFGVNVSYDGRLSLSIIHNME